MTGTDVDGRIRALIAAGEFSAAATEAIRAHGQSIRHFLRAALRNETDAAEAYSRFAESLWCALPAFRGESAFKTWALRIAARTAKRVRDEPWRRRGRRLETGAASLLAAQVRTSFSLGRDRHRRELAKLKTSLTPQEHALLVLRVDQELSWDEIAAILGEGGDSITANAVCKRFERLRARLTGLAREEGLLRPRPRSAARPSPG